MKLLFFGVIYGLSLLNLDSKDLSSNHAIYVSVLEIEQASGSETAKIMVKIFANDLEDAIFNQSEKRLNLLAGKCDQSAAPLVNYFYDHLQLNINGKLQQYNFVGCEINDISIWLTFEFKSPTTWEELTITADYLMELFPTQSNVVSIKYRGDKRMFRMTNSSTNHKLNF